MDIAELLKGRVCICGKNHTCDIDKVVIAEGAINKIYDLAADYQHIIVVADKHTYAVCGRKVAELLKEKLQDELVFEDNLLIPDETAAEKLNNIISDTTDLILGVGSGVVQDLCKYVSHTRGLPYYIVATAPSMDGYASSGAAMIMGHMKVTYNAHVPQAIIADVDVLKDAPMEMIQSGYGDIIGKLSCLNDWRLAAAVHHAYFCQYVYDLTMQMTDSIKNDGELLLKRDVTAVKRLMEALIGVGIAMAYVGNSRPGSGSEHHLSHFFEITGIMNHEPYFMHGTDVAFSTVYTCRMREEILKLDIPEQAQAFDRAEWESKIRSIYGTAAEGVIALQKKAGTYNEGEISVYKERWNEIRNILKDAPSADEIAAYLQSVGLDISDFEKMYGAKKLENAKWYAKDLKDRYSVLWLYYCLFYRSDLCGAGDERI
ncbi:MAG: sn-glycerol-1-phosphate dehydrogenase [Clostridia bacterium]|nr:sn-glycerol-1-phosphate dehydrogenase [Clostridia bacterium]